MGRVRELGTADDVFAIAERTGWIRPVIDFAHMHATSDGAFTDVDAFAAVLERADELLEPGAPFHIHFSDIAYANRNETKHLPYGEGTLRAEPLGEALRPLRAAGDRDQRVARRGVAPGGRARRSWPLRRSVASVSPTTGGAVHSVSAAPFAASVELREPLLVRARLLVAAALLRGSATNARSGLRCMLRHSVRPSIVDRLAEVAPRPRRRGPAPRGRARARWPSSPAT